MAIPNIISAKIKDFRKTRCFEKHLGIKITDKKIERRFDDVTDDIYIGRKV